MHVLCSPKEAQARHRKARHIASRDMPVNNHKKTTKRLHKDHTERSSAVVMCRWLPAGTQSSFRLSITAGAGYNWWTQLVMIARALNSRNPVHADKYSVAAPDLGRYQGTTASTQHSCCIGGWLRATRLWVPRNPRNVATCLGSMV